MSHRRAATNSSIHSMVYQLPAWQVSEIDVTGIVTGNGAVTIGLGSATD